MTRILLACLVLACLLPAQMQNSGVASLVWTPVDGDLPTVDVSGQPGQYFEIWGMLCPTFLGAEFTPWGVVDIPIFLQNTTPLVRIYSGYLTWSLPGVAKIQLAAPPGMVFCLQAIVGVNDPFYPAWWLSAAVTITT